LPAQAITLRPVRAEDAAFLYQVFAGTRAEEMAMTGWSPDQQDVFLRQQFRAQREHYAAQFPHPDHSIILLDGRPAGRLFVSRNSEAIVLVDISLLSRHRSAGIGTRLIEELLAEGRAAGKPVRLHVYRFNRAQRLYARLGFKKIAETPTHIQMEAVAEKPTA
jgi:ribosomal protein S18 acetylase RimI-like enzyme